MSDQLRYPLKAWVEGHYARDTGKPLELNPYQGDDSMASAWAEGWASRSQLAPHRWNETSDASREAAPIKANH
jgi:hypothetical protein